MARRAKQVELKLQVNFAPLPPEKVEAWRAGLLLLLELLKAAQSNAAEPAAQPECKTGEVLQGVEG